MSTTIKPTSSAISTADYSETKRNNSHNSFADEFKMASVKMNSNNIESTRPLNSASSSQISNGKQYKDIDGMVESFIKEAPLTSYQQMVLSSATAYEKQKLREAGQNPENVDVHLLFRNIVDTAARIEDTFLGSVNNKVSTLHTLPAAFLDKHSA